MRLLAVPVPVELIRRVLFEARLAHLFPQLVLVQRFQPDLIRYRTVHQLHVVVAVQQVADQSSEHLLINQRLALRLVLTCLVR